MNFPILLLANYRTGSSALVQIIGEQQNLEVFREPHLEEEQLQKLQKKIKAGDTNFIIKFMPDYIEKFQEYKDIYNSNCYVIKLSRRDKISQVTSYYVASITNRWNNPRREKLYPFTIDIDDMLIDRAIERIFNVDALLDNSKFSKHIVYEDIDFKNAKMDKLLPPDNYETLYSYIAERKLSF